MRVADAKYSGYPSAKRGIVRSCYSGQSLRLGGDHSVSDPWRILVGGLSATGGSAGQRTGLRSCSLATSVSPAPDAGGGQIRAD